MTFSSHPSGTRNKNAPCRGSVLVIVLWVAFGLVSIALYFGHAMSFELRSADSRVAGIEAEQAIDGAARYVGYLLANLETNGLLPDPQSYQHQQVPVGEATFWMLGREDRDAAGNQPFFALIDEASKLNLNTATAEMLAGLPRMTPELAAAIVDWRDQDSQPGAGGAEEETYLRGNPPYKCKNAPFESIEELRLVAGMDLEILYGEDANQNGVLDPNENDGTVTPPEDNRDGRLDPGILEYVTVYSREPNIRSDGSPKINIRTGGQQRVGSVLRDKLGTQRGNVVLQQLGPGLGGIRSLLEFFLRSRMTAEEFALVADDLTVANGSYAEGLVNVSSASEAVLACIPGIGTDKAPGLVAYRRSNPDKLTSLAWVAEVLDQSSAIRAGPYLTARSFQCTADIAATGHHNRGYRRARVVFDLSEGTPKILLRQDLSHLGWSLGTTIRQQLAFAKPM